MQVFATPLCLLSLFYFVFQWFLINIMSHVVPIFHYYVMHDLAYHSDTLRIYDYIYM